jgi:4-diphosphocytidyl-2-C-methyl-D-erythritol kinase
VPKSFTLRSFAKVNLYLRILRKRPDGFHELDTLFERISLSDTLTLTARKAGVRVFCTDKNIPTGHENTVTRAALALQKATDTVKGVSIRIRKRIPTAAGLGGGSSNAAAALVGLNHLWRLGLSKRKLFKIGASIGSDVPFFLLDTSFATGRGRGEILRKVVYKGPKIWHVLVKPAFGISTKEAYQDFRPARLTPPRANAKLLLHSIQKGPSSTLAKLLVNSLEGSLTKRVTIILRIKQELVRCGAKAALLSGSGSTVFGIFSSKNAAERASRILSRNKRWKVFVASTR